MDKSTRLAHAGFHERAIRAHVERAMALAEEMSGIDPGTIVRAMVLAVESERAQ